jgi:hypothetical protein
MARRFVLLLALILSATTSARAQDAPAAAERQARARRLIDASRVSVRFEALSLDACLEFLHEVTGLDVAISPEAREAAKDGTVSLRLRDVTVRSCLELILVQASPDLRWSLRHGVLVVDVRRCVAEPGQVALLDVSDVAGGRPTFRAPRLGLDGLVWDALEPCDCMCGLCPHRWQPRR